MGLDVRCARCQGYFRNWIQVVQRGEETYCTQCDTAIAAGAAPRLYDQELPEHNVLEAPALQVARDRGQAPV